MMTSLLVEMIDELKNFLKLIVPIASALRSKEKHIEVKIKPSSS
jgi:hypothetical protein